MHLSKAQSRQLVESKSAIHSMVLHTIEKEEGMAGGLHSSSNQLWLSVKIKAIKMMPAIQMSFL